MREIIELKSAKNNKAVTIYKQENSYYVMFGWMSKDWDKNPEFRVNLYNGSKFYKTEKMAYEKADLYLS